MDEDSKIEVIVRSHEGNVYNGFARRVSSHNEKGKFDIMPGHANFISLIDKDIQVLKEDGEVLEIPIENALLRNKNNKVEIYLGIDSLNKKASY